MAIGINLETQIKTQLGLQSIDCLKHSTSIADNLTQVLAKPIQLADQIIKAASKANFVKQESAELKYMAEKLVNLFRQVARASTELYERLTWRIVEDIVQVLSNALTLALKCRLNGLKCVFAINQAGVLKKMSAQLENSIADVSWLLRVLAPAIDRVDLGSYQLVSNMLRFFFTN
ncbi:hypothetical protein QQ045_017852 [Rhodiola kirilowii]